MNYLNLVKTTLKQIDDPSYGSLTTLSGATGLTLRAMDWVNWSVSDILNRTSQWRWAETVFNLQVSAGASTVSPSATMDLNTIKSAWHNGTKDWLQFIDYQEWFRTYNNTVNTFNGNSQTGSGVVTAYTIYDDTIRFDRATAAAFTFTCVASILHEDMDSNTDTPSVPSADHKTIIAGAVAHAKMFLGDPDAGDHMQLYELQIQRMLNANRRYGDRFPGMRGELHLDYEDY